MMMMIRILGGIMDTCSKLTLWSISKVILYVLGQLVSCFLFILCYFILLCYLLCEDDKKEASLQNSFEENRTYFVSSPCRSELGGRWRGKPEGEIQMLFDEHRAFTLHIVPCQLPLPFPQPSTTPPLPTIHHLTMPTQNTVTGSPLCRHTSEQLLSLSS